VIKVKEGKSQSQEIFVQAKLTLFPLTTGVWNASTKTFEIDKS
jgi:hypothetical protein